MHSDACIISDGRDAADESISHAPPMGGQTTSGAPKPKHASRVSKASLWTLAIVVFLALGAASIVYTGAPAGAGPETSNATSALEQLAIVSELRVSSCDAAQPPFVWNSTSRIADRKPILDDALCRSFGSSQDAGTHATRLVQPSSACPTSNASRRPPPRPASTRPSIRRYLEAVERGFVADDGVHWSDIGLLTYNDSLARAMEDHRAEDSTRWTQVGSAHPAYVHDSRPWCRVVSLCSSICNL